MAQTVKNLPEMQETQVPSLGQEDPLEKGMATHSSILAWRIPGTGETGGLQSMGSQSVRHYLATRQQKMSQNPREQMDCHLASKQTVPKRLQKEHSAANTFILAL